MKGEILFLQIINMGYVTQVPNSSLHWFKSKNSTNGDNSNTAQKQSFVFTFVVLLVPF